VQSHLFFHNPENAAPQSLLREVPEEAFHHVEPQTAGGRDIVDGA
jgi:hypothetical protein